MSNDFADHEKRVEEQPSSELCVECGGNLERCRCRPGCPGGHCVPCQGKQRGVPPAEHAKDQLRIAVQNARSFERELLVAKLEAEMFNDGQGADEYDNGYRAGWNSRARSIVEQLRGGK